MYNDIAASDLGTAASLAYGIGPPREANCYSCQKHGRTNKKWTPHSRHGLTNGWICPDCPAQNEPIRRFITNKGARFRAVIDVSTPGTGARKQKTATFDSLPEAREYVAAIRKELAAGTYTPPSRATLRQLVDDWLRSKRDVRPITLKGYRGVLNPVLDLYGDRPVQSLARADIESLIENLEVHGGRQGRPLSHRSIVYTLGTIRQVLAFAVSNGVLKSNPAVGVKPPRKTHRDHRSVSVWEIAHLISFRSQADGDDWAAAWRLTLSGLRRSEVLGLTWQNVNLEEGTVRVIAGRVALDGRRTLTDEPKSAASWRTVPVESMHPGTISLLRDLKSRQSGDRIAHGLSEEEWNQRSQGLVFVDSFGLPVRPDSYSDRFASICRAAAVPLVRLHDVRHSVALTLHRANVAPADAAALLGHTLAVHLATYVPRTERGVQTAAAALGTALTSYSNDATTSSPT